MEKARHSAQRMVMAAALGLGVTWRDETVAVAPKLEIGAARCGHLIFIAGSSLERKAKRAGWATRTPLMVVSGSGTLVR